MATDPLARAVVPGWRTRTRPQPVLRALCGKPTGRGALCHLGARHASGCLPPPARIVRPNQWPLR